MKDKFLLLIVILISVFFLGCTKYETENGISKETLNVSAVLEKPLYDTEIKIYGKVSLLGELRCPCFELTSDRKKVRVWYDLMVSDNETFRPSVSIEGIENDDWVIVTGELKRTGSGSINDFWASDIEKMQRYQE